MQREVHSYKYARKKYSEYSKQFNKLQKKGVNFLSNKLSYKEFRIAFNQLTIAKRQGVLDKNKSAVKQIIYDQRYTMSYKGAIQSKKLLESELGIKVKLKDIRTKLWSDIKETYKLDIENYYDKLLGAGYDPSDASNVIAGTFFGSE